jgi:hypothetical protein
VLARIRGAAVTRLHFALSALLLAACAGDESDGASGGAGGAGGASASSGQTTTGAGSGGESPAGCTPHLLAEEELGSCDASGCDQLHFGPDGRPEWCSGLCEIDEHCFGAATCYFDQTFDVGSCALPCEGGSCEAPLTCAGGRCVMNP